MATKNTTEIKFLQQNVVRITRLHFLFVAAYTIQLITFDAWHLVTPALLRQRWTIAAVLAIINTIAWYAARQKGGTASFYRAVTFALIVFDIFVAAHGIYTERGMASRSVALFAVPIIVSTALLSRSALMATASLSAIAYVVSAVRYFIDHPSEGYKIELYGEIFYHAAIFFILAAMLWVMVGSRKRH
jgi:hypothetical protein